MPAKAIIITFWGAIFAVGCVYALIGWRPAFSNLFASYISNDVKADNVILALVLAMVIRHQLRVAFFDSTYFTDIARKSERVIMALLFPAAILGGTLLLFFTFGLRIGAIAMAVYSVLFAIVGFLSASSHTGANADRQPAMVISFLIDFISSMLWIWVASVNHVSRDRALWFVFLIFCALTYEFSKVFKSGVKQRFGQALKIVLQ